MKTVELKKEIDELRFRIRGMSHRISCYYEELNALRDQVNEMMADSAHDEERFKRCIDNMEMLIGEESRYNAEVRLYNSLVHECIEKSREYMD
jgi:chromosome segregation ATPase